MYGTYIYYWSVRAFDHASIRVNTGSGISRNCLHIFNLARKSPQTTGPSPMDSPKIKQQILWRKSKVRRSQFFTHFIITWLKVFRAPDLHQCTPRDQTANIIKKIKSPNKPIIYAFYSPLTKRAQNAAHSPKYSPCIIEETRKNHQVRTYALSKSEHTSPQTPATSPTHCLDMTAPMSMQKDPVRSRN